MLWILLKTQESKGEQGVLLVESCVEKKAGFQHSTGKKKKQESLPGIHKACLKEVCKGLIRKEDRMA